MGRRHLTGYSATSFIRLNIADRPGLWHTLVDDSESEVIEGITPNSATLASSTAWRSDMPTGISRSGPVDTGECRFFSLFYVVPVSHGMTA